MSNERIDTRSNIDEQGYEPDDGATNDEDVDGQERDDRDIDTCWEADLDVDVPEQNTADVDSQTA